MLGSVKKFKEIYYFCCNLIEIKCLKVSNLKIMCVAAVLKNNFIFSEPDLKNFRINPTKIIVYFKIFLVQPD